MLADSPVIAMVPTHDLEKARKFYEDVVRLTAAEDNAAEVTFSCGGGTAVMLYETFVDNLGDQTVATWMVKDLRSEVADLKSRGAEFIDYDLPRLKTVDSIATAEGVGIAAWFKDPDGNVMGLIQRES